MRCHLAVELKLRLITAFDHRRLYGGKRIRIVIEVVSCPVLRHLDFIHDLASKLIHAMDDLSLASIVLNLERVTYGLVAEEGWHMQALIIG